MKKTVKFLLTSILTVTSLGLVSVNIKDVKNGFVESTNDVAGEKINVGKKNAKSTVTTDDFVAGESVRVTNAVAQRRVEDNGTTIRFVAAAKADNLTEGIIGGDLGFHVRYAKDGTTVNKYVAVESVYKSMVAGDTTYTNTKMGDFLVSTGLGEASNPNGYDVFITYSIAEIPSTHISTEFEVQPFFLKTGEETREFAPGTKKANATGYTLKVGNGNVMSLTDATDEIGEKDTTCINQYKAEGLTVKAGDKLVFAVDGKVVKPGASGAGKNNASYNMTTHEVSIINDATNVTIYLKVFDDGGYDTWVTGYVKPVTEGYVVKLNGSVTKVEELALTDGNHYAYSITLKAGDKVVTEKDGKALVLPEYKDGTEFECTVAGEHKFYINKEDKVYVTEPVAPVETKYTVTVNGTSKTITLIPDSENHAQFKLTLTKGDKVVVYGDGKALTGGSYTGTQFVVNTTGEHTFYVNREDKVYLSEPKGDTPISEVTTIYLKPNSNWTIDNAWFAGRFWTGSEEKWVKMTDEDKNGVYECSIPKISGENAKLVIFCRMDPAKTSLDWGSKWNQTADLNVPTDANLSQYVVTEGTWDKGGGNWVAAPSK